MSGYTKGPWRAEGGIVRGADGCLVHEGARVSDTVLANARLIAAAPELLGALQALADRVGVLAANARPPALNELELIRAVEVLAKATGSENKEG